MLSDSSDLLVYRIKVCFNKKEKKEKNFSPWTTHKLPSLLWIKNLFLDYKSFVRFVYKKEISSMEYLKWYQGKSVWKEFDDLFVFYKNILCNSYLL